MASNICCGFFLQKDNTCSKCGRDPLGEEIEAQAENEHSLKLAEREILSAAAARVARIQADARVAAVRRPVELAASAFDICGPFILAAASDGKPQRFEATVSLGPIESNRFDEPLVIDQAGAKMSKTLTAFLEDDPSAIVGHSTSVSTVDGQLKIEGLVSAAGAAAEKFLASAANGFPWQVRLKFTAEKIRKLAEGETVSVNGSDQAGPLYIASKSKLYGIQFVARGDDEESGVSISGEAACAAND